MKRSQSTHSDLVDAFTAEAFSNSWVNCFSASPYKLRQVREWFDPIRLEELHDLSLCDMGCGNGGLLQYAARYTSKRATGVDLGRSADAARDNFRKMNIGNVDFIKQDILSFSLAHENEFDLVYCIGVIHHMKRPGEGFRAVVRATRPGGRFHCWVYGYEGNFLIRSCLDPLRKMMSRLPWRFNKYAVALPMAVPFFATSQLAAHVNPDVLRKYLPLYDYLRWIGEYSFSFHHHVAFDQLLSPQTAYIKKHTIERWLTQPDLENAYIISRNGNSWKFGGRKSNASTGKHRDS